MKKYFLAVGTILVSCNLVAAGAIANTSTTQTASMTDLDLPVLADPIQSNSVADAPSLVEVLPEGNFSDVSPTHWAFAAVNNLEEDYGCLSGYPDGTFRGEEFVTRYEFAAAMDACLGTLLDLAGEEQASDAEVESLLEEMTELQNELGTLSEEVEKMDSNGFPNKVFK